MEEGDITTGTTIHLVCISPVFIARSGLHSPQTERMTMTGADRTGGSGEQTQMFPITTVSQCPAQNEITVTKALGNQSQTSYFHGARYHTDWSRLPSHQEGGEGEVLGI